MEIVRRTGREGEGGLYFLPYETQHTDGGHGLAASGEAKTADTRNEEEWR